MSKLKEMLLNRILEHVSYGRLEEVEDLLDLADIPYSRYVDRIYPKIMSSILGKEYPNGVDLYEEALLLLKEVVEEETGVSMKGVIMDIDGKTFIVPEAVKERLEEMDVPAVEVFLDRVKPKKRNSLGF